MLCSPVKANQCFLLGLLFNHEYGGNMSLVTPADFYSTLKMEAICSSKTSADFYQATQHYIPEDRNLHNQLTHKNCMGYSLSNET
jgi:hypothetical protein